MTDFRYSIEMRWSDQDGHYLAAIRELPGCLADGQTAKEAFENVMVMAEEWIETARELGRDIPPPVSIGAYVQSERKAISDAVMAQIQAMAPALQAQIQKVIRETLAESKSLSGSTLPKQHGDRMAFFGEGASV